MKTGIVQFDFRLPCTSFKEDFKMKTGIVQFDFRLPYTSFKEGSSTPFVYAQGFHLFVHWLFSAGIIPNFNSVRLASHLKWKLWFCKLTFDFYVNLVKCLCMKCNPSIKMSLACLQQLKKERNSWKNRLCRKLVQTLVIFCSISWKLLDKFGAKKFLQRWHRKQ